MAEQNSAQKEPQSGLPERAKDPGFWKEIWQQVRLVFALIRDPEVPVYLKLLPLAAVIYVLFPLDFAPDIYPVLGQLDDLTALLVGGKVFIEMAPPEVVARHLKRLSEQGAPQTEDEVLKEAIVVDAQHEMIDKAVDEEADED